MGHTALLSGRPLAPRRAVAVAAAGVLLMTGFVVAMASGGPHLGAPGEQVASSRSQLQWAATGAISNSLGRDQPAFHVATRHGGLIATNATQRLTASFSDQGVLVRSRAATFGLQLLAYGAERHLTPVAPTAPRADANRVLYSHGAVTEWYANGPLGVEQGFDVRTAPAESGHELTIELGLRGNVRARADGPNGLLLTGPTGQQLRYTGLSASDAHGRALHTALTVAAGHAFIHVLTLGAVYPLRIDPFIQVAKFGDPNPGGATGLGAFAVSVQGTTAAAAETPAAFSTPHVVDIFVANAGRWEQGATRVAQLTDTNVTEDNFGASLSLTPDGRTLAVGAPDANSFEGAAFVFEEPASGWASTTIATAAMLTDTPPFPGNDSLGKAVSISADGSTIAAGLPGRANSTISSSVGAVDVFERSGMHWATQAAPHATLTDGAGGKSGDQLGVSVALSGNGNAIVAGAWGVFNTDHTGEAQVYQQPPNGWTTTNSPSATLFAPNGQPGDFFGTSAAISADAKTIVIGATGYQGGRGAAFVFTSPTGTWSSMPAASATLMSSDGQLEQVGWSVATDGKIVVSGAPFVTIGGNMAQGAAYVFVMPAAGWSNETETQRLSASDGKTADGLGQSVGISNGTVIAAAPQASAPGATPNHQGFLYAFGTFPTTGISLAPAAPDGSNGWYVHPVTIAVSASDLASTVTAINCALDPAVAPVSFGPPPPGCAAFPATGGGTVTANGAHVLYAAAANAAGYASSPISRSFKIDTVAPQVTCAQTPDFLLRGNGGLVPATVADATSGPAVPLVAGAADVSRSGKKTAILTGHDNAGNSTTVDCSYRVVAPRVPTSFSYTFSAFSKYTIFATLTAKKVPRGAQVTVGCKGGGCPFKRRVVRPPSTRLVCKPHHKQCKKKPALALANINLAPLIRHRHLHVNAKLTLTVTKLDTIGVISTFTIRHLAAPRVVGPTCLAPGSTRPGKGC